MSEPVEIIPPVILAAYYVIIGLCLGSFATALIHREMQGISWSDWKGDASRSACPACGTKILKRDLIPVFSWLNLHGKCRTCRSRIPPFYPLIELCCGTLALIVFLLDVNIYSSLALVLTIPFLVGCAYLAIGRRFFSYRLFSLTLLGILSAFVFFQAA